ALFESLHLNLVIRRPFRERRDRIVQVAVFGFQAFQLFLNTHDRAFVVDLTNSERSSLSYHTPRPLIHPNARRAGSWYSGSKLRGQHSAPGDPYERRRLCRSQCHHSGGDSSRHPKLWLASYWSSEGNVRTDGPAYPLRNAGALPL